MSLAGRRDLADLCAGIVAVPTGIEVTDVALDSRKVCAGGLFLACAGRRTHGLATLSEALARGVRAVLWEPAPDVTAPPVAAGVHLCAVERLSMLASRIAGRFFADPSASLQVVGITGTNGKTTTAWLLAQALSRLDMPAAYFGTLGVGMAPAAVVPGEYTTADAVSVQRQLAAVRAAGARCVAMEVSSHALDQHRVAEVRFRVAAFTNLTRDHLDYHGTMEAYGAAKARLFDMPQLETSVFNVDDAFGAELAARHAASLPLVLTARDASGRMAIDSCRQHGVRIKSLIADDCRTLPQGLAFTVHYVDELGGTASHRLTLPLLGEFNVDNALITMGLLVALGVSIVDSIAALESVTAPPGRMEAVSDVRSANARGVLAIVDYAHTPDALAKALGAARAHCRGRLHVVFGCGGDRDAGKRSLMGGVAAAMADTVVITDDNPRSEPPAGIVADIQNGLPRDANAIVIHDRTTAIRHALTQATAGDVVLVAGKGHENYQIVGTERRTFSDTAVIRAFQAPHSGVTH